MSTTRFADAIAALLAAYAAAPALAGIPVYDGPAVTAADEPDFVIVGHDGTVAADGTLETTALAGTYTQAFSDFGEREERGSVNCLIVSASGDSSDLAGRRARAAVLLAAAEDAAAAQGGQLAAHLSFDGTTDGRFITRQSLAGVAVLCAYRVSYSAPWG